MDTSHTTREDVTYTYVTDVRTTRGPTTVSYSKSTISDDSPHSRGGSVTTRVETARYRRGDNLPPGVVTSGSRFHRRHDHRDPRLRATSRFLAQPVFVTYKGILALYVVFWSIWWPCENGGTVYLYFTYWGWCIAAVYFAVSFVTAFLRLGGWMLAMRFAWVGYSADNDMTTSPTLPPLVCACEQRLLLVQWFAWNVVCEVSPVIAVIYWFSLYQHGPWSSSGINVNLFLLVIMVVDNMLVATPFRVLDIFTTYAFCAAYLLFNIVWYYFGPLDERLIYGTLDWKNCPLASAVNVLLTFFILLPVSAWIHYGVFRLREFLYRTCRNQASLDNLQDRLLPIHEDSGSSQPATAPVTGLPKTSASVAGEGSQSDGQDIRASQVSRPSGEGKAAEV